MEHELLTFTIVIEPDEDQYRAYVPALPAIQTFGDTVEEARAKVTDAIRLFTQYLAETGELDDVLERGAELVTTVTVPRPADATAAADGRARA